ncbi:MAG: M48 family metallopeptidase [Robiginitomaculum sp.]|nr:M48 family metallopeptidase [Robiginitomaculum sp.]
MAAYGLKTQIWNNNLKSGLLLAGFPILLSILLFALVLMFQVMIDDANDLRSGLYAAAMAMPSIFPVALVGAGIWFVISFFGHQKMIDMSTGAKSLQRKDNPHLYNMLENLCISRGMPVPNLRIIETPERNAYASGIREKAMSVTLTRGLIDSLNDAELEAVIAHELTHIRNKDVRLLVVAIIFVGIFSFAGEIMFRGMFRVNLPRNNSSRRSGGGNAGVLIIIAIALVAITWALAVLVRFAISRRREFLADAGAVELTRNPDAMISALQKISARSQISAPPEVQQMFIHSAAKGGISGLFATHPPIEKRIEALVIMGGQVQTHASGPWG